MDQAPVGISHIDMQGRWIYVNQRFCDIVGCTKEELLNKRFAENTPEHIFLFFCCIREAAPPHPTIWLSRLGASCLMEIAKFCDEG